MPVKIGMDMNLMDQHLAQKFAAFEQDQDPALLYQALELLETSTRDLPPGSALSHWLRFLAGLDRHIDPDWDPQIQPRRGVLPPSPHGIVYPDGEVEPASIPDPAARAAYEQALSDAREAGRRYRLQFQLQRVNEHALRIVELFLLVTAPQEFENLLADSDLSAARRQQLRDLLR